MQKVYKKLTEDQKQRGIIFSSCLSVCREEMQEDTIHEVKNTDEDKNEKMRRLTDDKFFNASHWKFNIIRK